MGLIRTKECRACRSHLPPAKASGLSSQSQRSIFNTPAFTQGSWRAQGHRVVQQALPGATGKDCVVSVFHSSLIFYNNNDTASQFNV